jgi:hypothetical protein
MPSFSKRDRRRDVFVSHASEDIEIALRLCASLEKSGWSVFLAARDLPGELESGDWSQRIDEALDGCGVLVLLASPEALTKRWVTYEWRSFHDDILADRGGWLVPCCVREVAPDQLGRALRRYQIVDLRTASDWEPGFFSLLAIIEGYLKRPIAQSTGRALRSVLTIDGAAVRTIVAVAVLERLEAAIQQAGGERLVEHFDLIVGDDAGGVLAAHLALGARVAESKKVIWEVLPSGMQKTGLFSMFRSRFRSRFSSTGLVASLASFFGDADLSTAPKCALSTFDLAAGQHRLWSSHPALGGTEHGPSLATLTAACMAVPTYFDPIAIEGSDGTRHLLCNGGLWEADPCRVGLEAVRRLFSPSPLIGDIILVAVGSGRLPNPMAEKEAPSLVRWASIVPTVLMAANRQLVHQQVEGLYRDAGSFENYFRFDPELPADGDWRFDDIGALDRFWKFSSEWADSRSEQILHAAKSLMSRCSEPLPSTPIILTKHSEIP